jgi:hypothetical protein
VCLAEQIVIIGAGMAALALTERLKNLVITKRIKIRLFDAGSLAPSGSIPSTAIVARYGLKKGLSPLGDELDLSYSLASDFYQGFDGSGVERVDQWHLSTLEKRSSHLQRFKEQNPQVISDLPVWIKPQKDVFHEKAYLITPQLFLEQWKGKLEHIDGIDFTNALVTAYSDHSITLLSGENIAFDKLFLCHGAIGESLLQAQNKLGKQVMGHVYSYQDIDLGDQSFVIGLDGKNCVYRCARRELFVGGTTCQTSMLADYKTLENQRKHFCDHLQGELAQILKFPGKIQGGPRHKASQRRVVARPIQENHFQINGLYKNGYSSCFFAAEQGHSWLISQLEC